MTGLLRRRRAPNAGVRALQTAGPRRAWLAAATAASLVAILGMGNLHVLDSSSNGWFWIAMVPIVAFVVVGFADRDGILARRAIIEYAQLQPAHRPPGYPTDGASAEVWLADPANASEHTVRRAYALALADRPEDAATELDRTPIAEAADQAGAERLRAVWAAGSDESWNPAAFERALATLSEPDSRWQRLALAWMLAAEDIRLGRPWRDEFVRAVRDLGPWHTSGRGWFVIVTQQFTFPIVLALTVALVSVVFR